jgi:protein transport protein SEC13
MSSEDQQQQQIETQHGDIIHDTQFDYYGRYVATCSSDKTVRVFRAADNQPVATLVGHSSPVWMVGWAPPEFGSALASCSYDGKVIIWKEAQPQWRPSHVISNAHTGSVNAISWSSASRANSNQQGAGVALASAGSDGKVVVTSCIGGVWNEGVNVAPPGATAAHPTGALCVSFAMDSPSIEPEQGPTATFLASGGCDANIRIFAHIGSPASDSNNNSSWTVLSTISGAHGDWVRDVAFSPDSSSRWLTLASCSEDKTVIVRRTLREKAEAAVASGNGAPIEWEKSQPVALPSAVWRLSWSPDGSMLLATTGDSQAFLLKPGPNFADAWTKSPVSGN